MFARLVVLLALLGLVGVPTSAPAADEAATKPALLVRLRSIDGLIEDLSYIAKLAGQEEQATQARGFIASQKGTGGLHGIDTTRPIGLYGTIGQNVGTDSSAVALIPIASEQEILDFLKGINIEPAKEDDGIYRVNPPGVPVAVYFKFANKYAYVTAPSKAALAKDKMLSPAQVMSAKPAELLFASFRVDMIPDLVKQLVVNQVEQRLADAQEKKEPNETETQHALKVQVLKDLTQRINTLINEGESVTVRANVDQKAGKLSQEWTFTGKPGSSLANAIRELGQIQSEFAGFIRPDAAASFLAHLSLPEDLRKGLGPVIDEGIHRVLEKEKDQGKRHVAELFLKAIDPTLKAGELDAAISLRKGAKAKLYTFVGGIKLRNGQELEKAVREVAKNLPEAERGKLKLDAESAGEIKIHRVEPGKDLDAEVRRNLGDNPFYFAIRSDALIVAGGENGLTTLKQALKDQPKTSRQLEVDFAWSRLAPLMKVQKGDPVASAQKAFTGPAQSKDKMNITLQGGEALKLRIEVDGPVLTFFGLLDKASKE